MRRVARGNKDRNHDDICAEFTQRGLLVLDLTGLGDGAPDALVCNPYSQQFRLVEIKGAKGKLRQSQIRFRSKGWPVDVIQTTTAASGLAKVLMP